MLHCDHHPSPFPFAFRVAFLPSPESAFERLRRRGVMGVLVLLLGTLAAVPGCVKIRRILRLGVSSSACLRWPLPATHPSCFLQVTAKRSDPSTAESRNKQIADRSTLKEPRVNYGARFQD